MDQPALPLQRGLVTAPAHDIAAEDEQLPPGAPLDQLAKRNPTVDFVSLEVDYKNDKLARALCDSLGVEAVPYVFVVNGGEGTADAFICGVTSVERLQRTLHRCAPDGCPHDADFGI